MKKAILYTFLLGVLATVSSCKCQKCKHDVLSDSKICKEDFNSNEEFQDAVEAAEDFGYKCSPSN